MIIDGTPQEMLLIKLATVAVKSGHTRGAKAVALFGVRNAEAVRNATTSLTFADRNIWLAS